MGPRSRASAVFVFAVVLGFVSPVLLTGVAHADVQHTIGRGHTIEAIANRYHVTTKAIIEANHLKDVKKLRVGDVLTIPGVTSSKDKSLAGGAAAKPGADKAAVRGKVGDESSHGKTGETREGRGHKGEKVANAGNSPGRETTSFSMKAKTPGVVHVRRLAANGGYEEADIRIAERGRVSPAALKTFEKVMRSPAGMAHPIDARLVALVGVMSNHFGSRKLELVSGFRPFTPTQFNPHSNHMHGKAIDFRVAGVPNEAVRDFCRTLKNVGCGYYPNSVFVHMDVREQGAFWIDYSKPGEPPRYNAPNVEADEGTSDVQEEGTPSAPAAPAAPPTARWWSTSPSPSVESPAEPTSPSP